MTQKVEISQTIHLNIFTFSSREHTKKRQNVSRKYEKYTDDKNEKIRRNAHNTRNTENTRNSKMTA